MNEKDFKTLVNSLEKDQKILVSACLVGIKCRYDETGNLIPTIRQLMLENKAIPVCPEVLGGASTPREPGEIVVENGKRKVVTAKNEDVTESFVTGAERALETAKKSKVKLAILKSNSPSCGCGKIYDGTFTHTKIDGDGITTALLKENGIRVITEEEFEGCINK
ncbi:MAG: DUF523 domain-containing protein [Eubacteriaceae bacterium]